MKTTNILVTGAAGFIGSHLCEALLGISQKDYSRILSIVDSQIKVIGLDNFCDFYSPAVKRQNIQSCLASKNFTLVEADIRDEKKVSEVFSSKPIDLVVHLAAMPGVRPSIRKPGLYTDVNVNGTLTLLEACKKYGVTNFIFASSSSVYGNNPKIPFSESDRVDTPISPYAATKKAGELLSHTYHHLYNISMICLRYFTVYGPRQRPDLAIHFFARRMLQGKPIPVFGNGTSERDYTYIDDIVDGTLKAINFVQTGVHYEIFNLGESRTISLNKMIETLEKALGIKAKKESAPLPAGDVIRTYADIEKSKKLLGYNPDIPFEEGIQKFVDWLKNSGSTQLAR
jgi:UDP-glucuronate 4-epimerase